MKAAALKAQDVLVVCKLFSLGLPVAPESGRSGEWTYASLSEDLGISTSEIYQAIIRCRLAQLVITVRDKEIVSKKHFCDLLVVAVPRIFYAVRGGLETGMLTGIHAAPLEGQFEVVKDVLPTVWACSGTLGGRTVRGESISPLYPSVPEAASKDDLLYELLALVDVVRVGDTRSRNTAVAALERKILGRVTG